MTEAVRIRIVLYAVLATLTAALVGLETMTTTTEPNRKIHSDTQSRQEADQKTHKD